MKRKFTFLITAALMLLTMMATTGTAWATDVTFSYSDYIGQGTQSSGSSYTMEKTDVSITNTKFYGNNSYAHFYANGTTTITPGDGVTISQIVLTASATNYNGYQSSGTITASTGSVSGNNTTVTWTGSATNAFTISNNKQIRWTSIVVTYTSSGGGSGGSDPTITLSESGTLNIGNYAVSTALDSRTFTVSQSNLSDDITLTATNGGALSHSSIDLNADPTEVTWNFTTPAEAGQFTSVITATSGETSASFTYMGYAYEVHNVNIAQMEHGSVTANPTSTFYYQNVTLTVTPDEGYELDELTVVDANNNPVTVSNNSFKMPNSDVTVSATFVESSGSAVVDELTNANTIGQTTTNYTTWTAIGTSGAEYAGQSAGGNGTIQLRTTNNNSGIVSTSSAGKVKKVIVDWYSGTSNGRTLYIYGSNTAYESPSELYDSSTQGTLLGTIVCGTSTELTISDDYEFIGMRSSSGAMYINEIDITWETSGTPSPSFTISNNDEIAYNATSGSFNFTVNNPVDGGTTTVSENVDWISNAAVSGNSVSFTTTANEAGQARVGVVTLTYTYGDNQTVNKDVTVSQAGNPNVINNISSITASGTFYRVKGTVVAKGAYAFVLGDGTGYIYYYNGYVAPAVNIGEKKVIEGTTGNYGNVIQFTNSAAISASETSNYDGTPEVTVITEVPDYSTGLHLSTYLQFEGQLTKTGNYYYVSVGSSTINIVNPSTDQATTLTNLLNKNVRVKGFFAGNSNSAQAFTVLMESVEEIVPTEPTITVAPATVNAPFAGADGTLAVTYENITNITAEVYFCDAQGEAATYDWITASIDNDNNVEYIIDANDGAARTAYLKVYALDDQANDVYSNIVTINQEEYVAPTYAELPFEFNGGRNDIEGIDGLYQEGLGTDYAQQTNPTTRLKFDNTGDWLLLQFNERPGTLTFDIKGNSFSGSTFKVQTSEDGESYSDLETYTELSSTTQNESFNNLGENVRYIKWIYTEKSNGNVGLGNIALTNYQEQVATPTFTPEGDVYTEAQSVTIACETEGATIYYTIDGSDPTTTSTEYSGAIEVATTTTIKAIAAKDGMANSEIATATYTITIAPTASIEIEPASLSVDADAHEETFTVAYVSVDADLAEIRTCDEGGNDMSYDWFSATFASTTDHNNITCTIAANDGDARTAYFLVHVSGNVFSDIIAVSQEAYVVPPTPVTEGWVLTDLADLAEGDVFVIVGDNGSTYAMSNDNGTSSAPAAVEVTVSNDALSEEPAENLKWNLTIADGTYTFYPNGDTEKWLYCTNTNNGVRVGTNDDKFFVLDDSGYLKNVATSRYIGIYNSYDWRCYTTYTTDNIKNQTFAFYKYVENPTAPKITLSSYSIATPATETIEMLTITPANIENFDVNKLSANYCNPDGSDIDGSKPDFVAFDFSENEGYKLTCTISDNDGDARTAYFKVIYELGENDYVYSNVVTVNQEAYVAPVATITVNPAEINIDANENIEELGVTVANISSIDLASFNIDYCNSDGSEIEGDKPDIIDDYVFTANTPEEGYTLTITFKANEGDARTAYFKVKYELGENDYVYSNVVAVNQESTEVVGVTFELVESTDDIVPDSYYLITSGTNGSVKAMAGQTGNNRAAVAITASNGVITNPEGVVEFLISGSGTELNPYTIYDENVPGYLYAAGTGSSNYLKTQNEINARAQWTITINNNNQAIITALTTDTDRKIMRYNSSSGSNGVFSCYASGQQPIYLFKKVDNSPSITLSSYEIEAPAEPVAPATAITGSLTVTLNNITIEDLDQLGVDFCDENGELLSGPNAKPEWFETEFVLDNEEYKLNYTIQPTTLNVERVAYFKVYDIDSEVYSDLVTVTQEALVASIEVDPDLVEAEADETEGYLGITLTNIDITDVDNFDVYFCDEEGNIITDQESKPNWLLGEVQLVNEVFSLYYYIEENIVPEERIAYMKVYGMDDNGMIEVYSNLVTVTQAAAEYTVTFKVDECTHGSIKGSSINLPTESTCTPDGFAIYGWAEEGSTEAVADPYIPTADVTLYAILQLENAPTVMEKYVKVTEELTDWSGEYLIVYENEVGNLAFDGSLTTLDAAQNTIAVSITNNTIEANTTTDASMFTITALSEGGYSIQSASGYYIGQTSNNNGMATSQETAYANTISINDNSATIVSGGAYLRYNNASNQNRFRYYKSSSYTGQQAIQLYKKVSEEVIPTIVDIEYVSGITSMPDNIPESTCYIVEDGAVLTFTGTNEGTAANLVVQEGGQLIHTADVEATVQKGVSGYNSKSGDGWYLISSPVAGLSTSAVATGIYDLFAYDEETAYWWVDHAIPGQPANHTFDTLSRGKGYLYANAADVNLNYAGTMKATNANITVDLSFECDAYPDLKGFNLVGNPFTRNITAADMVIADMVIGDTAVTSYYDFNADRTEFVTYLTNDRPIQPGQGFFIQATAAGQKLVFNPAKSKDASDFKYISISAGDENFTDKAYIQFGYGNTLRKMTFGENTMVYVMNDDLDYAAARVEELAGTMPVHFVPIADGFYTITVETKNIENLNYMHLIDNITNTDIDLLAEPSYTFKASESDNADRFHLVFDFNNYTGVNENYTNDNFAHQIGDEIFVSGEGTLQVFDVLGRFVTGYNVNGDKRISTAEFNTGVYIFRMVGTEVKTQKIIVR